MDLTELWLPIVAATGAVFILSSLMWMALPFHKRDYEKLPGEAEFSALLRKNPLPIGRYVIGWCAPGDKKEPAKPDDPHALLLVQKAAAGMGKSLLVWIVYVLAISVLVGYLASLSLSLSRGADALSVFRHTSVAALLAYGGAAFPKAIWEGVPWKMVPAAVLDALVYAAATGAVFTWLWPK